MQPQPVCLSKKADSSIVSSRIPLGVIGIIIQMHIAANNNPFEFLDQELDTPFMFLICLDNLITLTRNRGQLLML